MGKVAQYLTGMLPKRIQCVEIRTNWLTAQLGRTKYQSEDSVSSDSEPTHNAHTWLRTENSQKSPKSNMPGQGRNKNSQIFDKISKFSKPSMANFGF